MRILKSFAMPLAAIALFAGTVAVAADLATIDSFKAVDSTPCSTLLCIVPSPAAVGRVCNVTANGVPVATVLLAPGPNMVAAPSFGPATCYAATGPGLDAAALHPDNPGIN